VPGALKGERPRGRGGGGVHHLSQKIK